MLPKTQCIAIEQEERTVDNTGSPGNDAIVMHQMPKSRFATLDGMRGIAAIAVVTYHTNQQFGAVVWLQSAYLAVDLFFVLSGFVIAHAYEHRFSAGMTASQFMRSRFIRLYPLYFLGLAAGIISSLVGILMGIQQIQNIGQYIATIIANLAFLPAPSLDFASIAPIFPMNTVAWSLFFELFINVIFVVFWRHVTNTILILVILTSGAFLLFYSTELKNLSGGWSYATLGIGLARVFYGFPMGVLIYRLREKFAVPALWPAALLFATALMCAPLPEAGIIPGLYNFVAVTLIAPALVALGMNTEPRSVLIHNIYEILGTASYGIYIIHMIALLWFQRVIRKLFGEIWIGHESFIVLIYIISVTAFVLLVDRFYDRPVRNWLTRQGTSRKSASLTQSA